MQRGRLNSKKLVVSSDIACLCSNRCIKWVCTSFTMRADLNKIMLSGSNCTPQLCASSKTLVGSDDIAGFLLKPLHKAGMHELQSAGGASCNNRAQALSDLKMWRGASFLIAFCFEVLKIFFKSRSAAQNLRRKYIKPRVSLKIGTLGFLMFTIFKTFCWVIFFGFYNHFEPYKNLIGYASPKISCG